MCRYAYSNYKPHYACFKCRKSFKRRLLNDINKQAILNKDSENAAVCPQCSHFMADMGQDFESPKSTDKKAWSHLKSLYESGVTFHSCGCTGPGYIPKDKEQLISYLNEMKSQFQKNRNYWSESASKHTFSPSAKKMKKLSLGTIEEFKKLSMVNDISIPKYAIAYWNKKIEEIEERILFLRKAS